MRVGAAALSSGLASPPAGGVRMFDNDRGGLGGSVARARHARGRIYSAGRKELQRTLVVQALGRLLHVVHERRRRPLASWPGAWDALVVDRVRDDICVLPE
jgi:hypothetical protein